MVRAMVTAGTVPQATGMEVGGVDKAIECQVSVVVFDP